MWSTILKIRELSSLFALNAIQLVRYSTFLFEHVVNFFFTVILKDFNFVICQKPIVFVEFVDTFECLNVY